MVFITTDLEQLKVTSARITNIPVQNSNRKYFCICILFEVVGCTQVPKTQKNTFSHSTNVPTGGRQNYFRKFLFSSSVRNIRQH